MRIEPGEEHRVRLSSMNDRGIGFVLACDTASELLDPGRPRVTRTDGMRLSLLEHSPAGDRVTNSAPCFAAKGDETLRALGYVE